MKYLAVVALAFASCMPQTRVLKIYYGGEAPVRDSEVAPMQDQIDGAAMAAAMLVGVDPDAVFETHAFVVTFHDGPMAYDGELYAGLSLNESVRVLFTPKCLFDPRSALLHEFVHQMFGIRQGGDQDSGHKNARWQVVPRLAQALAEHYCPDEFPPFMPTTGDSFP